MLPDSSSSVVLQVTNVYKQERHAWKIPTIDSPQLRGLARCEQIQWSSFQELDKETNSLKTVLTVSVNYLLEQENKVDL